jgi:hypothetical protein
MTKEHAAERHQRNAIAVQKYRERKKEQAVRNVLIVTPVYQTPQSLGKAVAKAKAGLPTNLVRQGVVLQHLIKRNPFAAALCAQETTPTPLSQHKPWNTLPEETVAAVKDFFCSEDVTWTSPLARDFVRIPGTSKRMNRIYLVCTLKEAHNMFLEKHLVCLCNHHENFR